MPTSIDLGAKGRKYLTRVGWSGNDASDWNWYVEVPVDGADELVAQVVRVLRRHFGVAHPQLLTYQAAGPASEGADVLQLCATHDVPTDAPHAPNDPAAPVLKQVAVSPGSFDHLHEIVGRLLEEKYEDEPTVDDDGDFVLHQLDRPVWVRVLPNQPAVEIIARVAYDVRSRRAAAVELGLSNRNHLWSRWTLRQREVWQTVHLPAQPFAPRHLDVMLDLFFEAMADTRDDLALRLRAKAG